MSATGRNLPGAERLTCVCTVPQYPIADGSRCRLFRCKGCGLYQPWCCGAANDPRCDACMASNPPRIPWRKMWWKTWERAAAAFGGAA